MTDATDPLLRDPLVQYLGILRAQHADYNPLAAPEFAPLVEPYLALSKALADLVLAAVDNPATGGLDEVEGLLLGMLEPLRTATAIEGPIGGAVDFVAATLREANPAPGPAPRFTASLDGTYGLVHDRETGKVAHFGSEASASQAAQHLASGGWQPGSFFWSPAS